MNTNSDFQRRTELAYVKATEDRLNGRIAELEEQLRRAQARVQSLQMTVDKLSAPAA